MIFACNDSYLIFYNGKQSIYVISLTLELYGKPDDYINFRKISLPEGKTVTNIY